MAPTGSSHVNATLAVLCGVGGAMGYVKARSVPSVSQYGVDGWQRTTTIS